jgi:hypothetical protein
MDQLDNALPNGRQAILDPKMDSLFNPMFFSHESINGFMENLNFWNLGFMDASNHNSNIRIHGFVTGFIAEQLASNPGSINGSVIKFNKQ